MDELPGQLSLFDEPTQPLTPDHRIRLALMQQLLAGLQLLAHTQTEPPGGGVLITPVR